MSPLAEILLARGFSVQGSDIRRSSITDGLAIRGATVTIGHCAASLGEAKVVAYSTAIRDDNPELVAARERGLRILHRSELLAELLEGTHPIAIAGTHGKTTTTGMVALALTHGALDPTAIVGGCIPDIGGHHRVGQGEHVVFEACESDGSFIRYRNASQVITSLEADHLDQHGSIERVIELFREFIGVGRPEGFLVHNADAPRLVELVGESPAKLVSYGMSEGADYRVTGVRTGVSDCEFEARCPDGKARQVALRVPGAHNALNATAALAASVEAGVEADTAIEALGRFTGAGRRFEVLYEGGDGVMVVDDYAHHPTEIEATLSTAKDAWEGRVIAVFQPHLFSRTKLLMDGFAHAFGEADEVILTEIYPAREEPIPGVTGEGLWEEVRRVENGKPVRFLATKEEVCSYLLETLEPGDMALILGAGDIREVSERVAEGLGGLSTCD